MAESRMAAEIREIPAAVARMLDGIAAIDAAAAAIAARDPRVVVTIARGSSDHAAGYFKYACELLAGVPVASVGPSVASVYGARLHLPGAVSLAISQSGQSPDLLALQRTARHGGALTVAITNHPDSPLGRDADHCIALDAGAELSVAATKTFAASVAATLALLARWRGDRAFDAAVAALPAALDTALGCDWGALATRLEPAGSLYVLGRGPAHAIGGEIALKFKETCGLHAEAHSAAEVLHGPAELAAGGFPVLALAAGDAAEPQVRETAARLASQGAEVYLSAAAEAPLRALPAVGGLHPLLAPLALVVPAYLCAETLARRRGLDPDAPRNLSKVTITR